jgi:phosphoribosylglycinamide formyltransferase-1
MVNYKDILILASGGGSNAEAIVKYMQSGRYSIKIAAACNRPRDKAGVYDRLGKLGVNVQYAPSPKDDFSKLRSLIDAGNHGARFDLIILAGYMRILPADITERYNILNIHPSILPFVYKGSEDAYQDAINNCDRWTGCTVHKVTADVDGGPILAQIGFKIPKEIIRRGDVEMLRQIGLAHEHALYPRVVIKEAFRLNSPLYIDEIRTAAQKNLAERGLPQVESLFPSNGTAFDYWNTKER